MLEYRHMVYISTKGTGAEVPIATTTKQDIIIKELEDLSGGDLTDREIQEAQLVELRLISLKLDCLQPRDEQLDVHDLDSIEQ